MRKILYFAGMALMATLALASCKDDNGKDDGGNGGGGAQRLAVPQLVLSDTTETSVTVSWGAIENAATYTYVFNNGEEASTAETSFIMETPEAGEYTFRVKAVPAEGSEEYTDSQWSSTITYVFKGEVQQPEGDLAQWIGTYSGTSTHVVNITSGAQPTLSETPKNFELTFTASEDPNTLYVFGLSQLVDTDGNAWPMYAQLIQDETGQVGICILADATELPAIGTGGNNGEYDIIGMGIYQSGEDPATIAWVTGLQWSFAFFLDGDNYVSYAARGYFNEDGTDTFTVIATDLFSIGNDGILLYYDSAELPAVSMTLTKTGDAASASAKVKAMKNNAVPAVYAATNYRIAR